MAKRASIHLLGRMTKCLGAEKAATKVRDGVIREQEHIHLLIRCICARNGRSVGRSDGRIPLRSVQLC
jgi:hypothetical protein